MASAIVGFADNRDGQSEENARQKERREKIKSRLTIGGYGEAVYSRNFYSDNYLRYASPQDYKNESHGRFDLPHVVIMLGYDFIC